MSNAIPFVPRMNQIALSVVDLRVTERWFREGLGFLPAGGSRWAMRSPLASRIQGLPKAASTCWWLVDRNDGFQLELFQFEKPLARLMPADFRPCDIGYTRIGVWVADFDVTLLRLEALGTRPMTAALGERGERRICVRNPDGVFVELMERDPLPTLKSSRLDCGVAVRSITLSVPDLQQTTHFMQQGIGLREVNVPIYAPEHEALWGLAGAHTQSKTFAAGSVLVEVMQYLSPVGKARPDGYRISDQGILNIAFGARNKRDHTEVYRRCIAAGARHNSAPVHLGGAGVVYVNDVQNFSFELLWMKPGFQDRVWGFEAAQIARRPRPDTHAVADSVLIDSAIEKVWEVITDHEGMSNWSGFNPVTLVLPGKSTRNGYGSERRMQGPPGIGMVLEQVIDVRAPQALRYRVIGGSPFVCHQGEVLLSSVGAGTKLDWRIRFRPRVPGTGWLFQRVLSGKLATLLRQHLKPYAEARRAGTPSSINGK